MSNPESIKYELSSQLVASDVSGETVILDYEAGKYFGLEGVGSFIWSVIQKEGPVSLKKLHESILTEYEIDEDRSLADLEALLQNLEKNGLIRPSS